MAEIPPGALKEALRFWQSGAVLALYATLLVLLPMVLSCTWDASGMWLDKKIAISLNVITIVRESIIQQGDL